MSDCSKILYIDPGDNLDIVKNKIKETEKEKVILVLPEENKKLKNIEDLTILKKEVQKLDKKLSIFSTDIQYRRLAEDCGIGIELSLVGGSFLNQKGELSFRPSVSDILPKKEFKEEPEEKEIKKIFVPEHQESMKKTEEPRSPKEIPSRKEKPAIKKKISGLAILYIFVLFLMLVGTIFAFIWFPNANITLIPASEDFEFSGEFQVKKDANLDINNGIIPAIILKEEENIKKSFSSTGNAEGTPTKASGYIIVYNKDTSPHNFVFGTRFESKDGKIFKSETSINVPAGSSGNPGTVRIKVTASKGGEEYNIEPSTFILPGLQGTSIYRKVYGESKTAMSGGSSGEGRVVSEDDLINARKELRALQEAKIEELNEKILAKIPDNLKFLTDTIVTEKGEVIFDKKAGEAAENFNGQAKVSVWVLSFNEKDVQKIISKIVSDQVEDGVPLYEILSTQEIKYELLKGNSILGTLDVLFSGKEKVAWKVDEDKIKSEVSGKTGEEFQNYIKKEFRGKVKAELALGPFWVNKIPTKPDRVTIKVIYK